MEPLLCLNMSQRNTPFPTAMKQAASAWAVPYIPSSPQWWWSWGENLWYFLATGGCCYWWWGMVDEILRKKRLSRGCDLKIKSSDIWVAKERCSRREAVHTGVKTWVSVGSRVRGLLRKHRAWIEGWFSWVWEASLQFWSLWLRESEASCTETGKGQGVEDKQEARARCL